MAERKAFNFYKSYYDVFKELSKKDRLPFIEALLSKQFNGTEPTNLTGLAKFAYISQKNNIDSQVKGWEDKTGCKLNSSDPTQGGSVGGLDSPRQQEKGEGQEKGKEKGEYTSLNFYKNEIEKNKSNPKIEKYRDLVNFLFSTNPLQKPLQKVLSLNEQLSFLNYLEYTEICKNRGTDLRKTILALENSRGAKYKTFTLTLRNWIDK